MKKYFYKQLSRLSEYLDKKLLQYYGVENDIKYRRSQRKYIRKRTGFDFTNHAMLRYFERMEDYNLNEIKIFIAERLRKESGVHKQIVADMVVVTRGKTVLTIYKQESTANKIRRRK